MLFFDVEFGSERIPRSLLRGKRANAERYCSLRIEDSPQFAAESFNKPMGRADSSHWEAAIAEACGKPPYVRRDVSYKKFLKKRRIDQ